MPNGPDINDFSGQSWPEGNYSHTQPSAPHARGAQSPCARCGATLVTSDRFCGACGSPHDRAPFAQSARGPNGGAQQVSTGARWIPATGEARVAWREPPSRRLDPLA